MSSIVVFYGSLRKNGYTAQLIEMVISGAKAAGAEVHTYDLNGSNVKGCQ